ncbi:hypothetical protein ACRQV7_14165 [Caproiciproducens sp. R2]|uniref:hypothetical protein n=1 Tax=Caproiciproducens sp. R2 TaxID=3435187 RepID=UPI00403389AD
MRKAAGVLMLWAVVLTICGPASAAAVPGVTKGGAASAESLEPSVMPYFTNQPVSPDIMPYDTDQQVDPAIVPSQRDSAVRSAGAVK